MKVTSYKEKYERKKYAYDNLSKDYNELAENYNSFKEVVINSLESLKDEEQADLYDIGYNSGIEESIEVVADINVPLIFEAEKPSFLLTRLEYELLKCFKSKDYKYIARDKDGTLYIYRCEPSKSEAQWCKLCEHCRVARYLDDLFRFILWTDKEPTNIKELLNNCDVIEND